MSKQGNTFVSAERSERLLGTEVYVFLSDFGKTRSELENDLEKAFDFFHDFERQFSRFLPESELSCLNRSSEMVVSETLFEILSRAKEWREKTEGRFDVTLLPILEKEGYRFSWKEGGAGEIPNQSKQKELPSGGDFECTLKTRTIRKSVETKIDLGGIGKGYAVDRVTEMLLGKYRNGIVDAGGDMRLFGRDEENKYDGWAIEIESPLELSTSLGYLVLRDNAVATSGRNRRKWHIAGEAKHHLIDPFRKESSRSDILQSTVIAKTAEEADVLAKSFLLLGFSVATRLIEEESVPAMLVREDGEIFQSTAFKSYVWK